MLWMLLFLLVSLALAGLVVVYVAYPRRGEQVPRAPWLGEAMMRGVNALPTLDNQMEALEGMEGVEGLADATHREPSNH